MALHHFKKDVFNRNTGVKSNDFKSSTNGTSSQQNMSTSSNTNLLLGGINLGEVLQRTISDEMHKIRSESSQKWLQKGGS